MFENKKISKPLILFDGVCNLCNGVVSFVVKRDKKNIFQFASLQSDAGKSVLHHFHLDSFSFSSFILYQNGKIYTKSTAALKVLSQLSGGLQVLYLFIIIPRFIRDFVYDMVAKHRYQWFGKTDTCLMTDNKKFISTISY